ncbi:MAG: DUF3298 and DUF4163 domain-containing protein [Ruminococcaceae bacterium]|nr:DUF3298 and DUF4163 domain-containing protein [Oscillospiraceae bacterium]
MKKLSLFLIAALLLATLSGCKKGESVDTSTDVPVIGTEKEENSDAEKTDEVKEDHKPDEEKNEKQEDEKQEDEKQEEEKQEDKKDEEKEEIEFLTISKCKRLMQEWGEDSVRWEISWENLRLSDEDAAKYPSLYEAFETFNATEDKDNIASADSFRDFEGFEYAPMLYGNTEQYLMRADSTIVSIRSDYSSYTGGAHGMYASFGTNLSPETGEEIDLYDVVTDKNALYEYLFNTIHNEYAEEIFEDERMAMYEYFDEGLNWTIDYDKLTVYFSPYEIASFAAGLIKVDLWFDEHAEILNDKYTVSPASYAVELSDFEAHSFDLDKNDGRRDIISVAYSPYEEYDCGEVSIGVNGSQYAEDELYGTSPVPVLVYLDGKYYLYIEIGQFDGSNVIYVYEITKDGAKKIDELDIGFKKLWDYTMIDYGGYYRQVVNNPENMDLESYFRLLDTRNTAYRKYNANPKNGVPESKEPVYTVNEDNYQKMTVRELPATNIDSGKKEVIPENTVFTLTTTDMESYVDILLEDGKTYRIEVETQNDGNYIDGVDVFEYFVDVSPDYGFDDTEGPELGFDIDHSAQIEVPYVLYEEEYVKEDGNLAAPSKIELIQFIAAGGNEEINRINKEINELYENYLYNYCYSDEVSCEFLAWPTVTDRYLNAVITHIAYPTYGTCGQVVSWVYDNEEGEQYSLDMALSDAGITKNGLLEEFGKAVSQWGGKALSIDSLAFRMLADEKIQFIAGVELEYSPGDTWVHFMTYEDGGVTNWDTLPFDPADVTGEYAVGPLYCQTLANSSQYEEN